MGFAGQNPRQRGFREVHGRFAGGESGGGRIRAGRGESRKGKKLSQNLKKKLFLYVNY